MKIILSRKGFDTENGRIPSPILPDGTLLSLPIPEAGSKRRFADVTYRGVPYERIITDLGGKPEMAAGGCHLDPDLRPPLPTASYAAEWVSAFGQIGAAQGHLHNQGVGGGDLFLFFGRFRQTECVGGRLRYAPGSSPQHIVYGYLQVGEVVCGDAIAASYPWHPHASYTGANNTLYVAASHLAGTKLPGAGTLSCRDKLVLTAPGRDLSQWKLLDWMKNVPISYHGKASVHEDEGYFQSTARGQEFVIEATPAVRAWATDLICGCALGGR